MTRNSARQALQSHEWKIVALYLLVISRAYTCRHLDPIYNLILIIRFYMQLPWQYLTKFDYSKGISLVLVTYLL